MKKSIIIVALMAVTMSVTAQTKWFDFSNNYERCDVGFNIGMAGLATNYQSLAGGVGLNIFGVYLDFMYGAPEHKFDNHVTPDFYNDTAVTAINIGYQIPVLPWLRIMPLVGHIHTSAGITDASTVNVQVDDAYSAEIYHDFDVRSRKHYLNYGCGIIVQPIRWLSIHAVYSRQAIYGGISISLSEFSDRETNFID